MKILFDTMDNEPEIVLYDDQKDIGLVSIIIDNMRFRISETHLTNNARYLDINLGVDKGSDVLLVLPRASNAVLLTAENEYDLLALE